jgi:Uma2 family endonuclease
MQIADPKIHRFTREEYYKMADAGLFQNQRVELIDGEIVEMSPQKSLHASSLGMVEDELRRVFANHFWVRTQRPLDLGELFEPEPDIVVVKGSPREYVDKHPTTSVLIVEVSDTTLQYDRRRKGSLYASAGIKDYWIVNLIDRKLEVYRNPESDAAQPFGFRYSVTQILGAGDSIAPLAAAQSKVTVNYLLP